MNEPNDTPKEISAASGEQNLLRTITERSDLASSRDGFLELSEHENRLLDTLHPQLEEIRERLKQDPELQAARRDDQINRIEGLLESAPEPKPSVAISTSTQSESQPVSNQAQKGRAYLQTREELNTIKRLVRMEGLTTVQVRVKHPNLSVWNLADALSPEDRELFEHPNRWERGYQVAVFMRKVYGRSPATIKNCIKAFRKGNKQKI